MVGKILETDQTKSTPNMSGMGQSNAKLLQAENIKVRFDDVVCVDEAKKEAKEIVDFFLRDPCNKISTVAMTADYCPKKSTKTILAEGLIHSAYHPSQ